MVVGEGAMLMFLPRVKGVVVWTGLSLGAVGFYFATWIFTYWRGLKSA